MKLVVIPSSNNLDQYIKIGAKAFIFGLSGYSTGYKNTITIEELKKIRKKYKEEIFISLNKNIFNEEIEDLENILKELDSIKVNGVLYYDLAVLNLRNKLNLELDLVWNQTHMVTNYATSNYYYDLGVKYGIISSEITLEEINEIINNSKMKFFVNVIGHQSMAFSRRTLLTNYFKSIDEVKDKSEYTITNMKEDYIIREEEEGTNILTGKILNGSIFIPEIKADYLILNEDNIEPEVFTKVLDLVGKIIETKNLDYSKEIDSLIGDFRGFFNKKTIYKVKKNERKN